MDEHKTAVVQRLAGYLLTGQQCQLAFYLSLYFLHLLLRGCNEEHLRVDAVLSLRQKVGSHKLGIGGVVSQHTNLAGTCWHIDSYLVEAYLLLGSHHILVARTENLEDLRYALRTIGHSTNSLYTTSLENLADTSYACCHEDGRVHLTFAVGRRAEHNLLTTGNLGGGGKHQHRRKEWGSAARDIETHTFYGDTFLPTADTRLCLHFQTFKLLGSMKLMDVLMSQFDGGFQFTTHQLFGFLHLLLADSQRLQSSFVKLQLILFDSLVTAQAHIAQHLSNSLVQLGQVQTWARRNLTP